MLCILILLSGNTMNMNGNMKGMASSYSWKGLLAVVVLPGAKSISCSFSPAILPRGEGASIH